MSNRYASNKYASNEYKLMLCYVFAIILHLIWYTIWHMFTKNKNSGKFYVEHANCEISLGSTEIIVATSRVTYKQYTKVSVPVDFIVFTILL